MKRSSNEREIDHSLTMASCLMLLSRSGKDSSLLINPSPILEDMNSTSPNRVFECKTCNRQFPSFQALGGHRASHKKPRLTAGGDVSLETQSPPAKPKSHECSICGIEFAIGQALGGHMRRHRATLNDQSNFQDPNKYSPSDRPSDDHQQIGRPIVKKSNSRRVLWLDLNLTPFENDLELFKLGKPGPMVDCLF